MSSFKVVLSCLVLTSAACGADPLVGTWHSSQIPADSEGLFQSFALTLDLKADRKTSVLFEVKYKDDASLAGLAGCNQRISVDGTYADERRTGDAPTSIAFALADAANDIDNCKSADSNIRGGTISADNPMFSVLSGQYTVTDGKLSITSNGGANGAAYTLQLTK